MLILLLHAKYFFDFQDAAKNNPATSLVLSALSVIFVIAQLALEAYGDSLQQMLKYLNVDSKDQVNELN